MNIEEIYQVREWLYDVVIDLQSRYDLIIMASAVPQEQPMPLLPSNTGGLEYAERNPTTPKVPLTTKDELANVYRATRFGLREPRSRFGLGEAVLPLCPPQGWGLPKRRHGLRTPYADPSRNRKGADSRALADARGSVPERDKST